MKILSMTATFGKLDHETLTFQPGLNIIEAPNEWGKSTWCAFLGAMLYGLDTRSRSTKGSLADKERYAPWSGAPMSGRMDIRWQGRDITLERRTKGRVPMGDFKAYETQSGLPVPELTAANCGEKLLGVEESVFRRAGFIRFSDLPVTQDESLRSRLHALVTTGDEGGQGETLAKQLRDLKNECRFNKSGRLPQAQEQRRQLQQKLEELEALASREEEAMEEIWALEVRDRELANHQMALAYREARQDAQRLAQARQRMEDAAHRLSALEEECASLPGPEEARQQLQSLNFLAQRKKDLSREGFLPGPDPAQPPVPAPFQVPDPERTLAMDTLTYENCAARWKTRWTGGIVPMGLFFLMGVLILFLKPVWVGLLIMAGAALFYIQTGIGSTRRLRRELDRLETKYGSDDPHEWLVQLAQLRKAQQEHRREMEIRERKRQLFHKDREALDWAEEKLCGGLSLEEALDHWTGICRRWEDLASLRREAEEKRGHYETLAAMVRTAPAPSMADSLDLSPEETRHQQEGVLRQLQERRSDLARCQGRMTALGSREGLRRQLEALEERTRQLEDYHAALTVAQEALAEAMQELQRRFAPRITQRARELMASFTEGRYDRLVLGEDFSLQAAAQGEDTLHRALWRSDGTVDQLYLSLRLAVAEALTGDAPLILDDALVRFDDSRLKAALEVLKEEGKQKQVLLFTCQGREKALLP